MKRKDLEALIHLANPDQDTEGWKKKSLYALLAHSIRHLKYRVDHPDHARTWSEMATASMSHADEIDEALSKTNAIIDIFINRKLANSTR